MKQQRSLSTTDTSAIDTILNETSANMEKTLLDKVTEEGMVKCYSESEIVNREVVGRGGFGVVSKASLKHTGVIVAMKKLLQVYDNEQELYKKFVNEVCGYCCCCLFCVRNMYLIINIYMCQLKAHKKIDDHPNIIRFLGLYKGQYVITRNVT